MIIGRWRLRAVDTGDVSLDGGAMFGVVPKVLWERALRADELNRVRLVMRALLIEEVDGDAVILVDTGAGTKWTDAQRSMYGIEDRRASLERSLAAQGLRPGDVTDVLLTHLHFDHAGGATRSQGDDVVPAFENARYWVQRRNWEWANAPAEKDRASYRRDDFEPLMRHGVLELIDGPGAWRPGIELIVSDGHTTAMQLPLVSGGDAALCYCADLIPTAAHVRVPWVMAYDNQPLVTVEEKKSLLGRAVAEEWILFLEHDPAAMAVRVRQGEKGVEVACGVTL